MRCQPDTLGRHVAEETERIDAERLRRRESLVCRAKLGEERDSALAVEMDRCNRQRHFATSARTAPRQLGKVGGETKTRDRERVLLTKLVEGEDVERLAVRRKFVRGDVRADLAPLRVSNGEDVIGAADGQPGVALLDERERIDAGEEGLTARLGDVGVVDSGVMSDRRELDRTLEHAHGR